MQDCYSLNGVAGRDYGSAGRTVEDVGLPLAVTNMRGWETMGKGQRDDGDW
jgi:hypothetical protein